jgi:antitoxin ParD1/3/4
MANIDKKRGCGILHIGGSIMASTLNLSLTDELRAFIDENCGDGTLYATPSEFVRDLLRQRKLQLEADRVRDAIVEGYQDAIAGRTVQFNGNLRSLLKKAGK